MNWFAHFSKMRSKIKAMKRSHMIIIVEAYPIVALHRVLFLVCCVSVVFRVCLVIHCESADVVSNLS